MSMLSPHKSRIILKNRIRIFYAVLILLFSLTSCNPSYGQNAKLLYRHNGYPLDHLVWSPSGKQLAISGISGSLDISAIYILDVEAKKARLLLNATHGMLAAETWTLDETGLIFHVDSSNEFKNGIWIADVTGIDVPKFFLDNAISVAWSSNDQLAIVRRGDQKGVLAVSIRDIKTDGETTVFQEPAVAIGDLAWSADGTKLVFDLDNGEFRRRDIYVIDLKTHKTRQITRVGTNDYPSLSPDGSMVVYVKGDFSGSVPSYWLHIMKSDGACDIGVPGLVDVGPPAWSPDGRQIAFVGRGNGIFLLDIPATFGEKFLVTGPTCQ